MKKLLTFLMLVSIPLSAHAFEKRLEECKASYQRFFPKCISSFDQQRCLWEGLEALRNSDVFSYKPQDNDPITEASRARYKATREYKVRLKALKRDRASLPLKTLCFLEPNLVDYNDDIRTWRYDGKKKRLKALLRGVNQQVSTASSELSGFVATNLRPVADLDEPVFFSVGRFIGGGLEELFLTHTKIFLFFKIKSVRLKSYPNYEHPRYLSKNELKEEAQRAGVSVKEMRDFLRKENSLTTKHIEVRVTDLLLCEDEYHSDQDCFDPFPLRVSSRGRIY